MLSGEDQKETLSCVQQGTEPVVILKDAQGILLSATQAALRGNCLTHLSFPRAPPAWGKGSGHPQAHPSSRPTELREVEQGWEVPVQAHRPGGRLRGQVLH